jgi:hypothetical protein
MGKRDDLIKTCEDLKEKIKALETQPVTKNQATIKEIQLQFLRKKLTEVGRLLINLTMYERDHD